MISSGVFCNGFLKNSDFAIKFCFKFEFHDSSCLQKVIHVSYMCISSLDLDLSSGEVEKVILNIN